MKKSIFRTFVVLILFCLLFVGCSKFGKKSEPADTHEEEYKQAQPQYRPQYEEPKKYKPPDGGFGTLDDAREAREATQEQEKQSENAVKDTDK